MSLTVQHGRPVRKEGVWLRQVGQENAVVDPGTGSVHLLNPTAVAIWQLCDGETEPQEMVGAICQISGLPWEVVAEDISRILGEFQEAGIVDWKES
jgi:PqqD family protein of HPr-rel-A system